MSHGVAVIPSPTTAPHQLASHSPQQKQQIAALSAARSSHPSLPRTVLPAVLPQPSPVSRLSGNTLQPNPSQPHFSNLPINEQRIIAQVSRLSSQHHLSDYSILKFGERGCQTHYIPLSVQLPNHIQELQASQAIEVNKPCYFPASALQTSLQAAAPVVELDATPVSPGTTPDSCVLIDASDLQDPDPPLIKDISQKGNTPNLASVECIEPAAEVGAVPRHISPVHGTKPPTIHPPTSAILEQELTIAMSSTINLPEPLYHPTVQRHLHLMEPPSSLLLTKTSETHPINISFVIPPELIPSFSDYLAKAYPQLFPSHDNSDSDASHSPASPESHLSKTERSVPVVFNVPEPFSIDLLHFHSSQYPVSFPPILPSPLPLLQPGNLFAANGGPFASNPGLINGFRHLSEYSTPPPLTRPGLSHGSLPKHGTKSLRPLRDYPFPNSSGLHTFPRSAIAPCYRPPLPRVDPRSRLEIEEEMQEALQNQTARKDIPPPLGIPVPSSNPFKRLQDLPTTSLPYPLIPALPSTPSVPPIPPPLQQPTPWLNPIRSESQGPHIGNLMLSSCPGKKVRLQGPVRGRGTICRSLQSDLERIAALNVKLIINCLDDTELSFLGAPWEEYVATAGRLGVDVLRIPTPEGLAPLDPARLNSQLEWVIKEYTLKGLNILVHCRGGVGRAGLVAASWVIKLGLCGNPFPWTVRRQSGSANTMHVTGPPSWATLASQGLIRNETLQLVERVVSLVRRRRSMKAIETYEQARFLVDFVEHLLDESDFGLANDSTSVRTGTETPVDSSPTAVGLEGWAPSSPESASQETPEVDIQQDQPNVAEQTGSSEGDRLADFSSLPEDFACTPVEALADMSLLRNERKQGGTCLTSHISHSCPSLENEMYEPVIFT